MITESTGFAIVKVEGKKKLYIETISLNIVDSAWARAVSPGVVCITNIEHIGAE